MWGGESGFVSPKHAQLLTHAQVPFAGPPHEGNVHMARGAPVTVLLYCAVPITRCTAACLEDCRSREPSVWVPDSARSRCHPAHLLT
jgi:hypothetical protein